MKPIQYITHQNTVWYNVTDYTRLLVDTHTIWAVRPSSPRKRHRQPKTPTEVVLAKVNRLSPVYQIQLNQEIYVDWVIFEHLYRLLKPFLVQPDDWTNSTSFFRQILVFIDRPKRLLEPLNPTTISAYFTEIHLEQSY
ncbi:hypothetical protein [Spirosoma flavum]|uniref:Transposase n=1 Tax=Spirosoma flavum TaxID=2048557 RepID=A0ABW6AJL0_9BACT